MMVGHQINNYRYREVSGKFLVTTDSGKWIFLSKDELTVLKSENLVLGSELFAKLKESGIVLVDDNILVEIDRLRKRISPCFTGASLHIVIPTLKCNHRCVYCHAGVSNSCSEEMSEETAKKTVDFIFQSPSKEITIEFQGGEPLMRFDMIRYITEYAKEKNFTAKKDLRLTVVTNLSLMDEEKLIFFLDNDISICTSLDGPRDLHDFNRKFLGDKSSYDMVTGWIDKIRARYDGVGVDAKRINALITITKKSLENYRGIIDEYVNRDLLNIHLRFLNNLGDAKEVFGDIGYAPEEFIEFWKKSIDYILEINMGGRMLIERGAQIILKKLLSGDDPNYLEMRSPCGACTGQLAYTAKGEIFSCDEARMLGEDLFKVGDVASDTYKDVLGCNKTCSIIASSVNDSQMCDACVYKPYCGICPVCNYAEQGSLVAKIPETARCKIYMAQFDYLVEKLQDKEAKMIFDEWVKYP